MQNIEQRLILVSSRKSFDWLREKSPVFCVVLNDYVSVTRVFFNHIRFEKKRSIEEVNQRLLIIPIIPDILNKGKITQKKNRNDATFFRLEYLTNRIQFGVVLRQKNEKLILFSCFIVHNKKGPVSGSNSQPDTNVPSGHLQVNSTDKKF